MKENDTDKNAQWEIVYGVVTPGGDPYYVCSNCNQGGHCYGIEHLTPHPKICPNCGAKMINND